MTNPQVGHALDCARARALIDAFLLDELEPTDAARLAAHVKGCAACTAEIGGSTRVLGLLGALPTPRPTPDLDERILLAAFEDRRRRGAQRSWLSDLRTQVIRGAMRTTGTLIVTILTVALLGGAFVFAASQVVAQLPVFAPAPRATLPPVATATLPPASALPAAASGTPSATARPTSGGAATPTPEPSATPAPSPEPSATPEPAASPSPSGSPAPRLHLRSSRRPARPRNPRQRQRPHRSHHPRTSGARRRHPRRHRRNCGARSARLAVPGFRKAIKEPSAGSGQGKEQTGRSEPTGCDSRIT